MGGDACNCAWVGYGLRERERGREGGEKEVKERGLVENSMGERVRVRGERKGEKAKRIRIIRHTHTHTHTHLEAHISTLFPLPHFHFSFLPTRDHIRVH